MIRLYINLQELDKQTIAEMDVWRRNSRRGPIRYSEKNYNFKKERTGRYAQMVFYDEEDHKLFLDRFVNNEDPKKAAAKREYERRNTKHGKRKRGGAHKLNEEQILQIREDTRTLQAIADDYGISRQMVYVIKQRQSWKHIS